MPKGPTVREKLSAFADWYEDADSWYTRKALARIMLCAESSVGAAVNWLRKNGFIVTTVYLPDNRQRRRVMRRRIGTYVYNVRKGELDEFRECAVRTQSDLSQIRQKLRGKVGSFS